MNEYQVINGVGIIPAGAKSIDKYAFERNKDITSIVIPDTVKRIGDGAFQSCTNLREVIIVSGNFVSADFGKITSYKNRKA